jgi:hypothetical protein
VCVGCATAADGDTCAAQRYPKVPSMTDANGQCGMMLAFDLLELNMRNFSLGPASLAALGVLFEGDKDEDEDETDVAARMASDP